MEVVINHESIGTRSCDAEYYYSNYFLTQLSYDSGYLERAMKIRGIFDAHNFDVDHLSEDQKEDRSGREFTKNGHKYRRFNFICPINNGLARDGKLLPPNIPYKFRFVRAKAHRSTLLVDNNYTYDKTVIPIIQPTLEIMYITSSEVDSKMNRLKGGALSFSNYPIRQLMLNEGLHEYNLDLVQGQYL